MIKIEKTTSNQSSYHIYFDTVYLGDAERDESGYYNFWFTNDNKGCWTSHSLRLIADKLDELNKEWNDIINEDLNKKNEI